jgi:dephospho-CoA kinase
MIICICGKSGSGKSTIAKMIQEKRPNSIHIDIDKIGHMSHKDEKVKKELITTFGKTILTNNNSLKSISYLHFCYTVIF